MFSVLRKYKVMEDTMPKNDLRTIFFNSLRLSASAFGGGYVLISLMRRSYTERLGWLSEDEMLDVAAISQTAPGASAVNAAVLTGYKLHGMSGAAVAVIGTLIPPLVIMSVLAALYDLLGEITFVAKLLRGMQCGVAAVLLYTVCGMTRSALKKPLYVAIFAAVLVLMLVF